MLGARELEANHPQSKIFPLTVRTLRELSIPLEAHVCADRLTASIRRWSTSAGVFSSMC